jgi:hypothetical protein
METIVFFYPDIVMGGVETLILRLMRWYIAHKYRVILLTLNKIEDNAILKDLNDINNVEYYVYDKNSNYFCDSTGNKLLFTQMESVTVLTFFMDHLVISFNYISLKKYNCKFRYRIYCVHHTSSFLSRKLVPLLKPFIQSLIKHKILIFMDELSRDACINYYKLNNVNLNFEILRLPMEINRNIVSKSKNEKINILSIARFDFPFKGYILGLIDAFKAIATLTNNITLTIIGYGKGEDMVNQKLIALPITIQKQIKLLDKVPYDEITAYIDQCDLFVGMGTTTLDAANRNKICIVPVSYQENDLSTGFFYDDYTNVGVYYNPMTTYHHFPELISYILSVDNEKFIANEDLSKSLLAKYYDIDKIAPLFVAKQSCYFSFFEKVYLVLLSCCFFVYYPLLFFFKRHRHKE